MSELERVQIIGEVGSVHDGSFGNAMKLIAAGAQCGADVIKFQTHIASAETLRDAPMPPFFKGEPRYEYFERTAFSIHQLKALKAHCLAHKIDFISSPFSEQAVDMLEQVGVNRYKIGSGEVTNLPLLKTVAQTGKPVLLSSGMSTWAELDQAVNTVLCYHSRLTVMQCTSEYPCAYEDVGLNVMMEFLDRYKLPVGLSDHTLTNYMAFAAVTLGATVVERHFTFSRLMYGSDAQHSLEPPEFMDMVRGIRAIEAARKAKVDKDSVAARLKPMKQIFEKSVVVLVDLPVGTVLEPSMLAVKKPGTGIPARRLAECVGRRLSKSVAADSLLQEDDLYA